MEEDLDSLGAEKEEAMGQRQWNMIIEHPTSRKKKKNVDKKLINTIMVMWW